MRLELIILLIAGLLIANVYTEGKYLKQIYTYKKYYQMAAIAFVALMIYVLLKKNPLRARQIVNASNEYIKYLPIDKNTSNMISPILDFTSKYSEVEDYEKPIINIQQQPTNLPDIGGGGFKKPTKRSVSESKKKFVASRQSWRCSSCGDMLTASFEVDHIKRLEYGGDNHIDNLRAMCRNCHGQKTITENL